MRNWATHLIRKSRRLFSQRDGVIERQTEFIRPHFDADFYLAINSDVAAAGVDPVLHYVKFGAKEGRDPSPNFSTVRYLEHHPDLSAFGTNPYYHYLLSGAKQQNQAERSDGELVVHNANVVLPKGIHRCVFYDSCVYALVDDSVSAELLFIKAANELYPFEAATDSPTEVQSGNLLIGGSFEQSLPLTPSPGAKVRIGRDLAPARNLTGGHTAYVEVPQGHQAFSVHYKVDDKHLQDLLPGAPYRFSGLFAAHRASCEVVLALHDHAGNRVERFAESFDHAVGGQHESDYANVEFQIPASDKRRRFSVTINYLGERTPAPGLSQYMFLARLSLSQAQSSTSRSERLLPGSAEFGAGRLLKCDVTAYDVGRRGNDLFLQFGGAAIPLLRCPTANPLLRQRNSFSLVASSELDGSFSFYFDGKFIRVIDLVSKPIALIISQRHLDGKMHHGEIRDKYGIFTLAEEYFPTSPVLTPFDAIQRETTPPWPSYLSHAARVRYLALQGHLAKSAAGAPNDFANVMHAHHTLEQGFETLSVFKPIKLPTSRKPLVSIIIPAHNKCNVTYHCLCALIVAFNEAPFEVILVDDGSADETRELPKLVSGLAYARNANAEGFIAACRLGAKRAKGKYLVFLNNDTEPTMGWIDELLQVFNNFSDVGLAGSKLLYPDGRLQEAGGIVWRSGNPWNYGRGENPWDPHFCYSRQADYLSGAALMIRTDVWNKVGGFSEEFRPAYFEDTDLAFKVREAGYKTYFAAKSIVYHFEGVSSGNDVTAGAKRHQEVNRPIFKRKWNSAFRQFAAEGRSPDLEKDRGVIGRVLFIDHGMPRPDFDAGSYAALQEMQLVQALGYKVTFVPVNVAWLGHYSDDVERLGIEISYAPFTLSIADFLSKRGTEFDAVYITRYQIALQIIPLARRHAPQAKVLFNLADLHFLRELRSSFTSGDKAKSEGARLIRQNELATIQLADLTLTYNEVEREIIQSHVLDQAKVAICPWVVDIAKDIPGFRGRSGITFLGGFGHPPNAEAVEFFIRMVMPELNRHLPELKFHVYGSRIPPAIKAMEGKNVVIEGHAPDIRDVFNRHRVFVAPLLSGAGVKGKVLSAMSHAMPSVLSPIAAEGIPVKRDIDCLVASTPAEWVAAIAAIYSDPVKWKKMSCNAIELMKNEYGFDTGIDKMRGVFHQVGLA